MHSHNYTTAILTQRNQVKSSEKFRIFDCDAIAIVGDVVFTSSFTANKVLINLDNREENPSIGIIVNKPTVTTATVQLFGDCSLTFSGLIRGKNVFLSDTGVLTQIPPTNGYLQSIGTCIDQDRVYIDIDFRRVKRTPF